MKKIKDFIPRCADCNIETPICRGTGGKGPAYCPTVYMEDVIKASLSEYENPGVKTFALNASIQEGECYVNREADNPHARFAIKPRIQETIEFANKMGYKRLGLAFCGGLKHEAKIVSDILKEQGFEVASVVCKAGGTPKELLGINEEQKVAPGQVESMCSPITQARLLNAANTEFNILLGLCVGHDSLMMRYSEALCTVLVVKDRVTGHNPLAAIQLYRSYYKKLIEEKFKKGGDVIVSINDNK
ncbi:MAG: DUF1847 domain-containing protein [Deltaproteobacteria bacterium]|nr:DUF1847 domain-containing protein [Deltaproteobacteria bacterium]